MRDKTELGLVALIVVSVGIAGWLIMNHQLQNSNQKFEIYLSANATDRPVISDEDIISYNKTSHQIRLNQEAINRVKSMDLLRKPFIAKLNGRPIFNGSFWSNVMCSSTQDTVITNILMIQGEQTDTLRIDPCYPPSCEGLNPGDSLELLDHFLRSGKLIQ